jgi:aspartate ammonia-lyase
MQLRQSDIFLGLNPSILKAIMALGTRHAFAAGEFVYHRETPADFVYILMEGEVELRLGDAGAQVFTIGTLGEVFGWSSLIGRDWHTVSAVCRQTTALMKMDKRRLVDLFESDPESGFLFYRHLARALGNRFLQIYDSAAACRGASAG